MRPNAVQLPCSSSVHLLFILTIHSVCYPRPCRLQRLPRALAPEQTTCSLHRNSPTSVHCADIKTPDDVLALGIDKYNEECRSIVMRCATHVLYVHGSQGYMVYTHAICNPCYVLKVDAKELTGDVSDQAPLNNDH
jgi:hypothetical protein